MKQFGWRSFAYIGVVCGISFAAVLTTAADGQRVEIDKDFYAAAAQVIPVLLLAFIVRISATRDLLVASEKEIEGERLELLNRVAQIRGALDGDTDDDEEQTTRLQLDEVEAEINSTIKRRRGERRTNAAPALLSEILTANLIVTLILGAGGIGAALAALALDPGSGALCLATALSIAWVLIGLVAEEGLHFLMAGSFGLD